MSSPSNVLQAADRQKWSRHRAAHLLRRVGFGATSIEIDRVFAAGLQQSLDHFLNRQSESPGFEAESKALRQAAHSSENIADLKMWWLHRMLKTANPLIEKMTLLWHNHFATSFAKVRSTKAMYDQNELFRTTALGDFRLLLNGICKDVAMLLWLDGNANKKRSPNENFARELFELFALGVGHYSESDIQNAARAFTGWHVRGRQFWFDASQHDNGPKMVFGTGGCLDGADIVDLCVKHPACVRFIATKLLKCFATASPDRFVVDAVATKLRLEQFRIAPTLAALFGSEYFYSEPVQGGLIKSPIDLVVGTLRSLDVRGENGRAASANLPPVVKLLADLGQDLFEPPTVKGWEGGRNWINSASYLHRLRFAAQVLADVPFGKMQALRDLNSRAQELTVKCVVDAVGSLLLGDKLTSPLSYSMVGAIRASRLRQADVVAEAVYLALVSPEYQLA